MLKRILILSFAVVTLAGAVTGCRTAEGAGEDIESAGEAIQRNVDE